MNFKSTAVLCFTLAFSNLVHAEGGIFYEFKNWNFAPSGGSATALHLHSLGIFDTSGGFTAGLRGALNKDASQKAKEYEIIKANERGNRVEGSDVSAVNGKLQGSYTYSWNQPAPVATKGETYRMMWSQEGDAWDTLGFSASSQKNKDVALLAFEYQNMIWSHESAPLSYGLSYGMTLYSYRTTGGTDFTSFSVPFTFTISTRAYDDVLVYADYAMAPYGYAKGTATYDHLEFGAIYQLSESWKFEATYKTINDYLTKDIKLKTGKYQASVISIGTGFYF